MEVSLVLLISENFIQPKAHVVYELSKLLQSHFATMFFDEKVDRLEIGLLMRLCRPGYDEKWNKPKRPTYVESRDVKSKLTGEVLNIRKQLRIELALDEVAIGQFLDGRDIQSKLFLIDFIASQFEQTKLPLLVKTFDQHSFSNELHKVKGSIE